MKRKPLIIAHRGASAEAPENTLAAFRLALEQGSDGIELDVHLSADDAIVVCHDETLERTTTGTGAILEQTSGQLRTYDAGRWFGERFAGEPLPLLDEVLDLVPPSVSVNIEIKDYSQPRINRRVLELLERRNRLGSVFFSSFDHVCMADLKRLEPRARIGLLYDEAPVDYRSFFASQGVEGYALHPFHGFVNPEYAKEAGERGLAMFPWTVDDPERMKELVQAGVTGIITNKPALLRELLKECLA